MVRVVRLGDGSLAPGRTLPGRGAWLCSDTPACVDTAQKRRTFERALRAPVDARAVDDLKQVLGGFTGTPNRTGWESPVL
jgi:predicted RNA-binding protein YlxR (DUF448 family)